jgi:serine/threonine protein kinase
MLQNEHPNTTNKLTEQHSLTASGCADQYIPELKCPGKSSCALQVIPIEMCKFDFPVPKNIDKYDLALFLHRKRVHSTRRVKQLRMPKADEMASRTLLSNLWAVRKSAFAHGSQDGSRFLKQLEKQAQFADECRVNKHMKDFCTPGLFSVTHSPDGSVTADMEYIPFGDCYSMLLTAPSHVLGWFIECVSGFIDHNLDACHHVPLSTLIPSFRQKQQQIVTSMSGSSILSPEETAFLAESIEAVVSYHENRNGDVQIPIGQCHGDLTLLNILVDSYNRKMCLLDFLDCFVESLLQDIAKLLQEFKHYWLLTQKRRDAAHDVRIISVLNFFRNEIVEIFASFDFWPASV